MALEIAELKDEDFDLELTGFEDDEISEILAAGLKDLGRARLFGTRTGGARRSAHWCSASPPS